MRLGNYIGLGSSVGGGGASPDPLADVPNLLYWRGTKDIATCGMYSDTACTMPITAEWDAVAGLKDESNNTIIATQADEAKRPLARVAADGSWYYRGDGSDDWLDPALTLGGQVTYSVVMRSVTPTWNSYWSPLDSTGGSAEWWGLLNAGSTSWYTSSVEDIQAVRRNGVDLVSGFDCDPIDVWQALTCVTRDTGAAPRGVFRCSDQYGNADCHALFLHVQPFDSGDVDTVDAYFNTIIPVE